MKKQIAITTASILIIGLSAVSVQAGSSRRHTIEGIIIGTGVTLLGSAMAHNIAPPAPARIAPNNRHARRPKQCLNRHGLRHWEVRRIWIEPVYQTRWHPGHYTRRGRWVPGRHKKILIAKGHWKKERVRGRLHKRFN